MALTIIRNNPLNDGYVNTGLETQTIDGIQFLTIRVYDNELNPKFIVDRYELLQDEKSFHKELRIAASHKKQLITSHSTNPEWNPKDYCKTLKDFYDEESRK